MSLQNTKKATLKLILLLRLFKESTEKKNLFHFKLIFFFKETVFSLKLSYQCYVYQKGAAGHEIFTLGKLNKNEMLTFSPQIMNKKLFTCFIAVLTLAYTTHVTVVL